MRAARYSRQLHNQFRNMGEIGNWLWFFKALCNYMILFEIINAL